VGVLKYSDSRTAESLEKGLDGEARGLKPPSVCLEDGGFRSPQMDTMAFLKKRYFFKKYSNRTFNLKHSVSNSTVVLFK